MSFIILYLAAFNIGNFFCSTNTFLFMRSVSNYVDETNLNRNKSSSKKSKQSAFYFAKSEKLTKDLKDKLCEKDHEHKEKVL